MTSEELESLTTPVSWSGQCLAKLARQSEREFLAPEGLTLDSYSTTRMAHGDPDRHTNWIMPAPSVQGMTFGIEVLPASLGFLSSNNGASLAKSSDMDVKYIGALLGSACDLVMRYAPELHYTVRCLVRSVHILANSDQGVDLSLSLPNLPFTVFLSIPGKSERAIVPRLAEALVHESLHLQLSLVERFSPMFFAHAEPEYTYSPWRDEYRPVYGIIHGMFVFRGVEILWHRASIEAGGDVLEFARDRVDEIRQQRALVKAREFSSLTPMGRSIFFRLAT